MGEIAMNKVSAAWRTGIAVCGAFAAASASAEGTYAEDRAKIEDLQARYLFALDFRDADAYAATFTEDGVLDYGAGKIKGRQAIREMVAGLRANAERQQAEDKSGLRPAAGRHNISNIVVDIDGDKATGTAYWFHMGNANPQRAAQVNSFGHYEDELVKVNGEWLFSLRKIYNEQIAEWVAGKENPVSHPGPGPKLRQPQQPR
jgi:ketosteroid isomerase-like protein